MLIRTDDNFRALLCLCDVIVDFFFTWNADTDGAFICSNANDSDDTCIIFRDDVFGFVSRLHSSNSIASSLRPISNSLFIRTPKL